MNDAKTYWDEYYFDKEPHSQGREAIDLLKKMRTRLHKGKTLDIGMGEGQNAVYLAKNEFEVEGFDISQTAIDRAKKLASEQGVTINAKRGDLDMQLFGLMEYDTIIMVDFKPTITRYYPEIIRALKQGGTLLVESKTTEAMTHPISKEESYKDYYFRSNELLKYLKDMRILFYQEAIIDGIPKVQCLAQKPTDKDALKYNLFDMHTNQGQKEESNNHLKIAEAFFKK